jgi:hypothetical protein
MLKIRINQLPVSVTNGVYYKPTMIVNDDYNDTLSCSIYDRHSDDSRGVSYAPSKHL